jgi:hypothetical protein
MRDPLRQTREDWRSKESIVSLLTTAGFTNIECEIMDTTMPYEQVEAFLNGFVKKRQSRCCERVWWVF